jgi:predicted Fe-Mo cluster-binding NifX family protein
MKVAITVWNQRISPVLESARTLLIAEIEKKEVVCLTQVSCDLERTHEVLRLLRAEGVETLICGAVSEEPAKLLVDAGIQLLAFIAGDAQQVLQVFVEGKPLGEQFHMPGCGKNICCRGKIRLGHHLGGVHGAGRRQR